MASWDRQPKEPPKAYQHFTVYRDFGPDRTLTKTSTVCGVTEGTLKQESAQWGWSERVDQWDAHVQAIQQRAFITEAAKQARARAKAFSGLLDKCNDALELVEVAGVSLPQVAQAMKIAAEGLRLEEGLSTANLDLEFRDVRALIANLPAEVRKPLIRALAEQARQGADSEDSGGIPLGLGAGD